MRKHGVGRVAACALDILRPSHARNGNYPNESQSRDEPVDHVWRGWRRTTLDEVQESEPRECAMWYDLWDADAS